MFFRSFEFEIQLPIQSLLRIQLWDWDMTSVDDMIAETKIDVENRWFSCHRATCGLPKRYDRLINSLIYINIKYILNFSAGYNAWRDTKKPTIILNELCRTTNVTLPVYTPDNRSVTINDQQFECNPECIEFVKKIKGLSNDKLYRKAHHESPEEYIRQNTALAALHEWGKKINPVKIYI